MEKVHDAIEWYQKKIGSYDKQLWEQSVEKKLQKQPEFVRQNAPRRKVRPKTEYIDVDLIRGSTFTKTKPQVPWVYVTKKALARVLFFPFYYSWWVHQTSGWAYACLLCLYVLQVASICVYISAGDGQLEDELSFTEVVLPMILMFLLCLIHSQTVLAHITHKPPKHKPISGVTRKIKPKLKKSAQKVNGLGNKSSSYPDVGIQANSISQTKQSGDVYTSSYAAQPSHMSLPLESELNREDCTMRLSAGSEHIVAADAQEVESSSHSCQQGERQGCRSNSVTLVQQSSSLSSFSSTLVTKSLSLSAGKELAGLQICDNHALLQTSAHCPDQSALRDRKVKIVQNGGQNQRDSPQPGGAGASKTPHLSLDSSVLGNLPITRFSCSRQDSVAADFDDGVVRAESSTEGSISSISDELDSEREFVRGPISDRHSPKTQLNNDHKVLVNGGSTDNKLSSRPDPKVRGGVSSVMYGADGTLRHTVDAVDGDKLGFSPHSSHQLPHLGNDPNNKVTSFIENGHSSSMHSPSPHYSLCSQDNDTSVNLLFNVKQISSQSSSPIRVKSNLSSKDPKPSLVENLEDEAKESNVLPSKVFSSPNQGISNDHHDTVLPNGKVSAHSQNPENSIYQPSEHPCGIITALPVNTTQEHSVSDCEGIQKFSEYLVDKILNRETLLCQNFAPGKNSSRPKENIHPRGSISQIKAQSCSKFSADHLNSYKRYSDSSSSTSLSSIKSGNKDNGRNLPRCKEDEPCFDSAISSLSTHTSYTASNLPEQTPKDNFSGLKRLRDLQCVKDAPEESNISDEDDDGNPGKELDVDADDDDDGEEDGTDSDLDMDKSIRLKQLRFQENLSDTKDNGIKDIQLQHQQPQLRRRRRLCSSTTAVPRDELCPFVSTEADNPGVCIEESRIKMVPNSLGLRLPHESVLKGHLGNKQVSSSEGEGVGGQTPEGSNKAAVSSEEWEDRIQTDETTSSAYSSSCGNSDDESEKCRVRSRHSLIDDGEERTEYTTSTLHVINLLQPGGSPSNSGGNVTQSDRVSCLIWEGIECKKVDLTALDIGWAIIDKVDSLPESSDYFLIGLLFSVIISAIPLVFRAWMNKDSLSWDDMATVSGLLSKVGEVPSFITAAYTWRQWLLLINSVLQRFCLSIIFFFLLSVADRTFKQRLLYAKHFSYLTSSRRARKFSMPHFRLSKVRNIKIWLSLRSYLKRRGPQRSVDVIVSACFMSAICTVSLISLQMLKDSDNYLGYLCNWELLVWCCGLAIFLMRFMTVGLKINKKYRNLSVLITEQINLYLQMEQKPHKKEELILANNVLRLAEDLLKELESPFKISGFSANPVIYNIMRVVVLSAFSAVLTEVLGFKLKLHKIKLKG